MSEDTKKRVRDANDPRDHKVKLEPTDAELLFSLSQGNGAGFWSLWTRHQKSLLRICLRGMGGHQADAEDALSQAMMKALESLPSCAGRIACPGAWLQQLARNLCVDLQRERRRRSEAAESWKNNMQPEPAGESPMIRAEAESEIQERIAALPGSLRESFVLHVLRGISVKKVAARLGLSGANVRKRVQLARARLRQELALNQNGGGWPGRKDGPAPNGAPTAAAARQAALRDFCQPSGLICTARVNLPCGVAQLFHVFPAAPRVSPGRQIRSLRGYLRQHPRSWKKHLELADLCQITGDWSEAVRQWRQAAAMRPHLPAMMSLGDTLLKLGASGEAAEVFRNARCQEFRSAATGPHLDGWIAMCGREAARAAMEFEKAADLEPQNSAHWHALAQARAMGGMTGEALAAIDRALQLRPDDLAALSLGHDILVAAGQIEEAIRRAERLLHWAPLDLLTVRRLVDCRCQMRMTQGADGLQTRWLLRRASRLSHNPLLVREPLAAFFLSRGEPQKALAVHREFLEQHPRCPGGRQDYSQALAATGQEERLQTALRGWELTPAQGCNGACRRQIMAGPLRG